MTNQIQSEQHRICNKCHQTKSLNEFRLNARKSGLRRDCRDCERFYQRQYYNKNRVRLLKRGAEWRKANPEIVKALNQQYYDSNPERRKQQWLDYQKRHPDKVTARAAQYRALKRDAYIADCPQVRAIYKEATRLRQQGLDVHVDHIIPLSKGGEHAWYNLRIIDAKVNLRKSNTMPCKDLLQEVMRCKNKL